MKDGIILGLLAGAAIGAVAVTMHKPARNVIKKGVDAIEGQVKQTKKK